MVMHANEVETKEKEKLPEIKNLLEHIYQNKIIYIKKVWWAKTPFSVFDSFLVDGEFY